MISFSSNSDFSKTRKWLEKVKQIIHQTDFDKYGRAGVEALKNATPVDSGKTADSWEYEIIRQNNKVTISWKNTNINDGCPIAIILQYGHATGWGGYVEGVDYINPAIRPIFNELTLAAWKEVSRV